MQLKMVLLTLSALLLLIVKNPMHAVLGLILVFINSAIFLLSLNVNFIGLVYLIVYVGAISVLFLFVIMLLNLRSTELANRISYKNEFLPFIVSYFIFLILYVVTTFVTKPFYSNKIIGEYLTNTNDTSFLTQFLFNNPSHFVLITILLLLAIIAPIAIASRESVKTKKQVLFGALTRETNTIKLIV